MFDLGSVDCDFSTGQCPSCGFKAAPHARRNCPSKDHIRIKMRSGPGSELARLLKEIGVKVDCSICSEWKRQMNLWGIDGCKEHRQDIIDRLKKAAGEASWSQTFTAASGLLSKSWFLIFDPYGSIVDEAIRRSENTP
jgi:hypothetical protein